MRTSQVQKFQVGDRVEATVDHPEGNRSLFIGDTGVVCNFRMGNIGVDWDKKISGGHTCDGTCEIRHGWYVDSSFIKLYKESTIDIDERSFLGIVSGTGG